ncbi:flagellar assembly peptidoglycan hydrolase FlgJ [Acerihabitans sp. TG2]|uniref:flagellar assembly peptidoglycan hydrolase FlgJ n=1 Tax=Acerihabitans sp. TG2 TaxID=3096008 RepID=UPI002B23CEF2|nr:flagellar assembly peptidoglycan hydrolase FlgJ [Acerihabitans sp. TG2]MEA9392599.1 flagellar assembly peptidoglycan hydrolase FlgJ [Acerihabitans sp. TG2]
MQLNNDAFDVSSAAFDAKSLQKLHNQAVTSSPDALKAVAKQVEGVFVTMMLKSMRAALPKGGLLSSNQTELYTSLYDQQMAQQLSAKGLGLADMMVKQLGQPGAGANGDALTGTPGDPAAVKTASLAAGDVPMSANAINAQYMSPALAGEFWRRERQQSAEPAAVASRTGNSFTDRLSIPTMLASQQSGIPHHLIMAQAALESNWGKNEIPTSNGQPSYNLFGIKASSDWQGKTTTVTTTEYQNGQPVKVQQRFRVYDSYMDALGDYIHLLTTNPRYREVVAAEQPEAGAYALQRAGYATDPAYATKLIQIISQLKHSAQRAAGAYTHDLGGLF